MSCAQPAVAAIALFEDGSRLQRVYQIADRRQFRSVSAPCRLLAILLNADVQEDWFSW
jgi:hypothetical protein